MNKKFTKLMAALALLTFLAAPLGMWGQTRAEGDTHDFSQTLQQLLNNNASISSINIAEQSYAVKKVTISYRYNKEITNAVTMAVTVGGVSWGTQYSTGTGNNYTTIDFEGTSTTGDIVISFTNNTGNGTGHGTFYVNNVRLTEGSSATITSLSYTGAPNKTEYEVGESFDPTGLTVTATYSDASTQDVTSSVVWTPDPLTQGTTSVTGTYSGQSVVINGITVTAPAEPNIVLDKNNKPYTSTSGSNTDVVTTTLDGIEYQSYAGYIYNNYLSFNRSESGAYLGNNTQLCGNIKKIVVDYNTGGATYMTMYEGGSALAETTTVSPSSTGTGKVTYTFSGNTGFFKLKQPSALPSSTYVNINSISIYLYDCSIYHVTYNANGATSGDVPTDATEYDEDNNTVTVLGSGNLAKTGYGFSGWNTVADGSGTSYNEDDTFEITGNTTLYAQWTAYTITAQSNDTDYGTVYLDGFTITASPADGCRYASPAYSVSPDNSAEVTQSGNTFTVTPTANTTVTINFEEIPTHTVTFSVNGTTTTSTQVAEGAAITFPADPANIDEMVFMGWTNAAIDGTQSEAPTFVTSATMGTSDVTFYAVFASVTPGTATTVTDELTRATTGVTTTSYSNWSGKKSNSDAVYAGNSAGGNNSIQLRTNNNNSGVVTTASGGKAKKVTISWNDNTLDNRILDIYGKNSAYSAASELYNANNQGTKLGSVTYGGNSTVVTITDDYNFIGMRSNDGAMYITSITIEWESVSPDTYSDYCTTVIIPTVAKPTFSQASGEVVDGTEVTMSCTTEGATIYYSTDDGATWTEGNTYTIHENVTLKAKAVNGSDESQVVEATYTVQYILTVDMEHVEYFIFNYHDGNWGDFPVDAEGRPLVHAGENVRVSVASVEDCYTLQGLSVTFGENTIVPEYLSETEEYSFIMPASSATLSASVTTYEVALFTYTKVTSVTPGKHYIIVTASASNGEYHAMGGKHSGGSYMDPIVVNVDNNTVTVAENEGVAEILIDDVTGGKYTLHTSEGYLAGGDKKLDINGTVESTWGISFDDDQAVITWTSGNTNYALQYNPSSPRFACYSSSQTKVCLYEKNEYDLTINGYGSSTTRGWNLIASPVAVNPANVEGMTIENSEDPNYSNFDLYYFDQTGGQNGKEWKNYKANHFNLVPGTGYLYANKGDVNNTPNTVTLTFTGVPYSGDGEIELVYNTANSDSKMHGWNLIGNPFSTAATLNLPFFKMNGTGSGFTSQNANSSVAAMEGVLVYAYDDDASQPISTATFTAAGRSNSESAAMVNIDVVSSFGDVMDNAIVNFNEGIQLPKFYFGTQNANIYIPQGNKEYAVVSAEAQGEMPVNFKAAENGTYTLTVNPEGVEMNYLHLIDNMTGADIDLLAATSTGSVATYTFNASTTDYSSRFRLVFAANNEDGVSTGSTAFAFYSNGNWIINNAGEATLQVVDVNGRILSSETVNGSVSKAINAPAGVYMLRLINGNDVKTQKIVVR